MKQLGWMFGMAGRLMRKSVGRESDVRGFGVCKSLDLPELDRRFSEYVEIIVLL
jgi:hypothetical protein